MEQVTLVDSKDQVIGTMDKLEAHKKAILHRAFSVLVYNSKGQMLLQKRAKTKYHSGGLWTNACCSHQWPKEDSMAAAKRRLMEEIGIDAQPEFFYKFIYKAELDNNLTEYEYDHVFTCITDQQPKLDTREVEDFKYINMEDLYADIEENPEHYTVWFRMITERLKGSMETVFAE